MIVACRVDSHRTHHVPLAELDAVDPHGEQFHVMEGLFGQCLEHFRASLDRVPRDLAFGDAYSVGHLGDDAGVAACGNAADEDFEHAGGQTIATGVDRGISGDFDLAGLAFGGLAASQSRLSNLKLAIFQLDAALLGTVVNHVTVGLLALLPRSGNLGGAHDENGFYRSPADDVDEVFDSGLGVVEEIQQGQDQLAVLGQDLSEWPGLKGFAAVITADDMVVVRHRWRLQS